MRDFDFSLLKQLYIPSKSSHKGQNGKLLIIGGSHLFHAASLWSLKIASRIVDMVFYSSVPENNKIVEKAKSEFGDGIVVRRADLASYAEEADCILVGPGMVRAERGISNFKFQISNFKDIDQIGDEGEQTYFLTKFLLEHYPHKRYVLDAGALQMLEPEWLSYLKQMPILTPHLKELKTLLISSRQSTVDNQQSAINGEKSEKEIEAFSKKYNSVVLLKGERDLVCSASECLQVKGGNAGMTKGGTGDVLAGLVAALYTKNEAFLSAAAASYINKKAGDELFRKVGYYFNASDLAAEIPKVMKEYIL